MQKDIYLKLINKLPSEFYLLTKIGNFKLSPEKYDYNLTVQFQPIDNLEQRNFIKEPVSIETNSSILNSLVIGNVWTENKINQNLSLKWQKKELILNVNEEDIFCSALYKQLDIPNDYNTDYFKYRNIPITRNSLYAFYFKFEFEENISHRKKIALIPAYEIVRFLFLNSSSIIPEILNKNVENHIFKPKEISTIEYGLALLMVDWSYTYEENLVFAKILYDENIHRTYVNIQDYFQCNLMEKKNISSEILTTFPFLGNVKLYGCGSEFSFNEHEYFIFYQIFDIDYKYGFDSFLAYIYKNDTRKGRIVLDPKPIERKTKIVILSKKQGQNENIDINGTSAPNSAINDFDFVLESEKKYETNSIERIEYEKLIQKHTYETKYIKIVLNEAELTINKKTSKDSKSIKINLNNIDFNPFDFNHFNRLLEAIYKLKSTYYYNLGFIDLNNPTEIYSESITNVIDAKKGIKVMIAELNKYKKYYYVCEFSGLTNIRILTFNNKNLFKISNQKIMELMFFIKNNGRLPESNEILIFNTHRHNLGGKDFSAIAYTLYLYFKKL